MRALIIIAISTTRVQVQGAVKWRDNDRFDSCMLMMLYSQSTRSTCLSQPSSISHQVLGERRESYGEKTKVSAHKAV